VKNLKLAFTVALSGFQSGGRYAFGNLEATPIVEDGIMYVPDGWVRSTRSTSHPQSAAPSNGKWTPVPIAPGQAMSHAAA
jgi:hypothetical protein